MPEQSERNEFIEKIRASTPSHTMESGDLADLTDFLKEVETITYSSLVFNLDLIIDAAMSFTYKYAGYTPGSLMQKNESFFSSDPLLIYANDLDSQDRCLIWANGLVVYNHKPMQLTLILDKKLKELIDAA